MTTYKEYQVELEKLHRQADLARLREKADALKRIKELIIEFQLLPSDLGFSTGSRRKMPAGAAKYRDPESGSTWSGRGRPPVWINGKDRAAFEI